MDNVQAGILAPVHRLARYLTFSLKAGGAPRRALQFIRGGESFSLSLRVIGSTVPGFLVPLLRLSVAANLGPVLPPIGLVIATA